MRLCESGFFDWNSRFIHVIIYTFLFTAEWLTVAQMYQSWFIYFPVEGYSGRLQVSVIRNKASINIPVDFVWTRFC